MPRRAATTRLEPGQHSIDRNTPRLRDGQWLLDWAIRLPDGKLHKKRSQAATKGEVRRRAKATAEELLATGSRGVWSQQSPMLDYLDRVSKATIETANLREGSKRRYLVVLELLAGRCDRHRHLRSMKGHSIHTATRFRALEGCLQEIAASHGSETAHQARTVLSKYVLQQLIRDELLQGNPLTGMSIDLTASRGATARARGGQALTRDQYATVVDYLLTLDPVDGQVQPARGRWSLADRVAKRRNAIDLTLLQAATGLRVSEANALTWSDVATDDDGSIHVIVTDAVSKTHRGRRVPILDPRVAERVLERRNMAYASGYVIGSPTDPATPWDRDNCQKAAAALYVELADSLGVALLRTSRTHVWRATLNSLLLDQVPEVVRAAFFGHDPAINRAAYTDLTDTSSMVRAATRLRAV